MLPWSLLAGVVIVASGAATSPLWSSRLLGPGSGLIVVVLFVAIALFGGHMTAVGSLAGLRMWGASSSLIAAEAVVRLLAVGVVALLVPTVRAFEVAAAVSALTWLVALVLPPTARLRTTVTDGSPSQMLRRIGQTTVAAVGTAVLVVGFPALLRATTSADEWATAAPLVLAISLTRAPLLLPLSAFQGVAISYFLTERRPSALVRLMGGVLAVGLMLAALAALVGPPLMAAVLGRYYWVSPWTLAALTVASTMLAMLTLAGTVVLALGRHRDFAFGWLGAAAVAIGCLFLAGPVDRRAVTALIAGPVAGLVLFAVVGRLRSVASGDRGR